MGSMKQTDLPLEEGEIMIETRDVDSMVWFVEINISAFVTSNVPNSWKYWKLYICGIKIVRLH